MSVEGSAVERLARLADEKNLDLTIRHLAEYWLVRYRLGALWSFGDDTLESACSKALDRLKGET